MKANLNKVSSKFCPILCTSDCIWIKFVKADIYNNVLIC